MSCVSCRFFLNGWSRWNDILEKGSEKIVQATFCCLTTKVHHLVTEKYFTEAKLCTHLFLTTLWISAAIAIPLVPLAVKCTLCAGTLLTVGPLYRYVKTIKERNSSEEIDEEVEVIERVEETEVERECRLETDEIQLEIDRLREKIRQIDIFIASHPQLKRICDEIIGGGYQGVFTSRKQEDLSDLDPNNLFDFNYIKSMEQIYLESEFHERREFFWRNPEVRDCIREILSQNATTQPPEETIQLLLEG